MKGRRKNGFTMAELLIVVAIVGVLVAISIPIFTSHIEKVKETHDIAIMRQAASAAIDLYYAGITDKVSANAVGLNWDGSSSANAYGTYDPRTGKFYMYRWDLPEGSRKYGKGTKKDGGMTFVRGNDNGAYVSTLDYTDAVVMVSIYVKDNPAHVDVYWKENNYTSLGKDQYIGGYEGSRNKPKYCMRITLN
ncbi:type IV pilin protein [Oribacterium sp. P6A1]|uniref:type IV pilin protein n=1 Tax=Oribacterium sp. P6A1 TaxID=1410612 RepID=UPI000689DB04|nr:type II secretion system protein [Oribacterium sp. P6A1]